MTNKPYEPTDNFTTEITKYIPEHLEPHMIYISFDYKVATHLCACGCGEKTVMPFNGDGWGMSLTQDGITFSPSIGSYQIPCKSHYLIQNSKVVWC